MEGSLFRLVQFSSWFALPLDGGGGYLSTSRVRKISPAPLRRSLLAVFLFVARNVFEALPAGIDKTDRRTDRLASRVAAAQQTYVPKTLVRRHCKQKRKSERKLRLRQQSSRSCWLTEDINKSTRSFVRDGYKHLLAEVEVFLQYLKNVIFILGFRFQLPPIRSR